MISFTFSILRFNYTTIPSNFNPDRTLNQQTVVMTINTPTATATTTATATATATAATTATATATATAIATVSNALRISVF